MYSYIQLRTCARTGIISKNGLLTLFEVWSCDPRLGHFRMPWLGLCKCVLSYILIHINSVFMVVFIRFQPLLGKQHVDAENLTPLTQIVQVLSHSVTDSTTKSKIMTIISNLTETDAHDGSLYTNIGKTSIKIKDEHNKGK